VLKSVQQVNNSKAIPAQFMQVAGHFVNSHPSVNLPSSAKVLALLASNNADDATVQTYAKKVSYNEVIALMH